MLDPWIIEQIRRREQEERVRQQPTLDLPLPMPGIGEEPSQGGAGEKTERGVVIIGI